MARDRQKRVLVSSVLVFLSAAVVMGWGMEANLYVYDEGIILTNAMRVAAGEVPHRDFYANYGPGQFYLLAGLFKLFGFSALVERAFDLAIRSAIVAACYVVTAAHVRSAVAFGCAAVCVLWLFSVPFYGYPLFPAILTTLIGTALAAPALGGGASRRRLVAAGAAFGVATLFRYDVGLAAFLALAAAIALAAVIQRRDSGGVREAMRLLLPYAAGAVAVCAPVAACYLAVAPAAPLIHDVVLFPANYYARTRNLPFPGIDVEPGVYLPPLICAAAAYCLLAESWNRPAAGASRAQPDTARSLLVCLIILTVVFYAKGFIRVSTTHMVGALIASAALLAILAPRAVRQGRYKLIACLAIAMVSVTLFETVRIVQLRQAGDNFLGPRLYAAFIDGTRDGAAAPCGTPPEVRTIACLRLASNQLEAARFLAQNTEARERVFVGTMRHDKIYVNNVVIYFAANRLPATRWAHFDPGLQTSARVQNEMISELRDQRVRFVVLDGAFDQMLEPNDSAKSSGVFLLDEYLRTHYTIVAQARDIRILVRKPE